MLYKLKSNYAQIYLQYVFLGEANYPLFLHMVYEIILFHLTGCILMYSSDTLEWKQISLYSPSSQTDNT